MRMNENHIVHEKIFIYSVVCVCVFFTNPCFFLMLSLLKSSCWTPPLEGIVENVLFNVYTTIYDINLILIYISIQVNILNHIYYVIYTQVWWMFIFPLYNLIFLKTFLHMWQKQLLTPKVCDLTCLTVLLSPGRGCTDRDHISSLLTLRCSPLLSSSKMALERK